MKQVSFVLGLVGLALMAISGLWFIVIKDFGLYQQILSFSGLALLFLGIYYHVDELLRFFSSQALRYSALAVLLTTLLLLALGLVNFIVHKHPKQWDLTKDQSFSASPQTLKVLESLQEPVQFIAFFDAASPALSEFKVRFDALRLHTDKLSVTYYDPFENPTIVRQFGVTTTDTVVVTSGTNERKITSVSEEELTNALIAVTRKSKKQICFLEGHGERRLDDTEKEGFSGVKESLEKQSFDVKTVMLYQTGAVPAECTALVMAGPTRPLLDAEKPMLEEWLKKGGRLIVLLDPGADPSLAAFLAGWGIVMPENLVIDPAAQAYVGSAEVPLAVPAVAHKITEAFQRVPLFFPLARSVERAEELPFNGYDIFLVKTVSDTAWGETDPAVLQPVAPGSAPVAAAFDEGKDDVGPLNLAALFTYPLAPPEDPDNPSTSQEKLPDAMIAVVGDADFASNGFAEGANGDLFLNMVSFLAQEDDLISIRPKEGSSQPLILSEAQLMLIIVLSLIVLPSIPLLLAVGAWLKRRNA